MCQKRGQSVDDFCHETYFVGAFLLGHSMVNCLDVGLNADTLIKCGHKPNDQIKDMVETLSNGRHQSPNIDGHAASVGAICYS
jgi:hypothetical protein